jgi:DNA-binding transcriptional LysR family regulator
MKSLENKAKPQQIKRMGLETILRKIHFRDLEIFEAVARLNSISAASRELKLHTPHVSKSLKRIELATESILFKRSKTGVMLTTEGREFLDFAQNLSKVISSTKWNENRSERGTKQQLITIAGTSYLIANLIASAISTIKAEENRYRYRLLELGDSQLISSALKSSFEIAIHIKALDWPKSWNTVSIGKFSWVLCGRAGHPLGKVSNESDVKKYPFVIPIFLNSLEYTHGEDRCPLKIRQRILGDEAQTAEVGLKLVAQSDQLIFVPEIMIQDRISQCALQKIQVRQWRPIRDTLFLTVHGDSIPMRFFEQLIKFCENITI